MNIFKDGLGRTWTVTVNVASTKRVKGAIDIDLMEVVNKDGTVLSRLHEDPETLVNVLYLLCKPQADTLGLTDENFGELFETGEILEEACNALIEALISFFPPRRREILRKVMAKLKTLETAAKARAEKEIDEFDVETILDEAYRRVKSGTQFTPVVQS